MTHLLRPALYQGLVLTQILSESLQDKMFVLQITEYKSIIIYYIVHPPVLILDMDFGCIQVAVGIGL